MFSHFGNLGFLGGMQPHPFFGMQQGMPAHYPGAFNPTGGIQPTWGANPQPIGGPMQFPMQPQQPQMPVQGTMQRYPLMSGMMGGMQPHPMMPGRINLGALGGGQMNSQMMRSPQAY
jgi:hypothetical protein